VRKALIREGYTQSEIYGLKNKATWRQLREKCAEHWRQTVDTESAFEAALHVQRNDVVLEKALRRLHQWTCLEALGAMAFNKSLVGLGANDRCWRMAVKIPSRYSIK